MKVVTRRINFNSDSMTDLVNWVEGELRLAGKTNHDITSMELVELPKDFPEGNTHDIVLAIRED